MELALLPILLDEEGVDYINTLFVWDTTTQCLDINGNQKCQGWDLHVI